MTTVARNDPALAAQATARLEAWLDRERPGWERDAALAAEARAASVRYTDGFLQGEAPRKDAAAQVSYAAYFGPRAITAVAAALAPIFAGAPPAVAVDVGAGSGAASLVLAPRLATATPVVAVDVGAGSGAASLVLACAGVQRLHLVDRDAAALAAARRLLAPTGARVDVHDKDTWPVIEDAQLVVASFVFSELVAAGAAPLDAFDRIRATAPRASRIVLVDAGDHARARALQELREALIARGDAVLAPCPHKDACPALVRARDWCHQRAQKHLPERLAAFARAVGRDDVEMAFAYLVVGRPGELPDSEGVLVLGDPLVEKGRVRLPVCAPRGVRFVQALKRDRDAYRAVAALPRGSVLDARVLDDVRADAAHVVVRPAVKT